MNRLLILLLLASFITSAEKASIALNSFNLSGLSIEGEGFIPLSEHTMLAPGAGIGVELFSSYDMLLLVPHQLSVNLGISQSNHFLELGYKGVQFIEFYEDTTTGSYATFLLMGYRHHGKKTPLVFKAYANPGFHYYDDSAEFKVQWGLALGFLFK